MHLTPSEFKVLALLAAEPERVFTRRQVMEHLWQSPYVGDERACDVHVSNLRRKIERSPAQPERIVTVRGVGYKLVLSEPGSTDLRGRCARLDSPGRSPSGLWPLRGLHRAGAHRVAVPPSGPRPARRHPATSCRPSRTPRGHA